MDLKAKYGPLTIGKDPKQDKKKRGGIGGIIEGIAKSAVKPFTGLAVEGTRAVGQGIPSNLMALGQLTGNSKLQSVGLKGSEAVDRAIGSLSENEEMKDWGLGGYFTGDERKKGELGTGVRKIGGNTAQQIGTVMPIARGAGVLKTIASGAKAGGLTGAGATATEDGTDLGDIITGGVMSAGAGGGLAGGGRLLSRMTGKGMSGATRTKPSTGRAIDAESSGLGMGETLKGGRQVTPDYESELMDFARNGSRKYAPTGVPAGKPRAQANEAQQVFNNVKKQLSEQRTAINRKLSDDEVNRLVTDVDFKVLNATEDFGNAKLINRFKELVKNKDIDGLEKLRMQYDDIGYTASGAGKTAKAGEARTLRDTIDEFVSGLEDEGAAAYKATKGDYSKAKDLLELTTKGSKVARTSGAAKLPIVDSKFGGGALAGAKSKTGNFMNRLTGSGGDKPPILAGNTADDTIQGLTDKAGQLSKDFLGRMTRQGITANAGTSGLGDEETPELSTEDYIAEDPGFQYLAQAEEEAQAETGSADPYDPSNAEKNVQAILQQGGDQKDVAAYLANVETLATLKGGGKESKPLNSTSAQTVTDLENGIANLGELSDMYASSGANNPLTSWFRGRNPYDTDAQALQQKTAAVKQVIGKALEGGVLRKEDEIKYAKILPKLGDTDAVAQQKISTISNDLQRKLALYQRNLGSGGGGALYQPVSASQGSYDQY